MAANNKRVISREISPPPQHYQSYGSHDEKGGTTIKIHLTEAMEYTPPPPDTHLLHSPSLNESVTANTDDEANPADATESPEPMGPGISTEYSPKSRGYTSDSQSPSHSKSRSKSFSYEESQIGQFYMKQEAAKKSQQYRRYHTLSRPSNLPPKPPLDDDDEMDDEIMDRILVNYQRQESSSKDKRRSISSNKGNAFSLLKQKSPSHRLSHKLPRIKDNIQEPPPKSTITSRGTRGRRAETAQFIPTSPSLSGSTFQARTSQNIINSNSPLPLTHIQKWQSITETEEPTPSPAAPSPLSAAPNSKGNPNHYRLKSLPIDMADQDGIPEDMDLHLVDIPQNLDPAKSTPNLLVNSDTSIAELNLNTKPKIAHLTSNSVNYTEEMSIDLNAINVTDNDELWNQMMNQSVTPRGRRSTINPKRALPSITRGFSESQVLLGVSSQDVDVKTDAYLDSGSDDDNDDDKEQAEDAERRKIDLHQTALALQKTTKQLMISCENSKEVFQSLWKICISLKKDPTYHIPFDDSLLKHNHVEEFLRLLGFLKNKSSSQWSCFAHTRVQISLIDTAILECHKCRQIIQQRSKTIELVNQHKKKRKNSDQLSSAVSPDSASKPPTLNLSIQPLNIIQQSRSIEESHIYSDDEDDEKDADSVQLYELIWGITHNNNEDPVAKEVLLLCYPLVTNAKYILYCLEARFFKDDHDGRSTLSNVSNASTADSPSSNTSTMDHKQFPSFGDGLSNNIRTHMRQTSSFEFGRNGMKYEKILSSFSVQAKVIEFIRHWMVRFWDKDWDSDSRLMRYCKVFMRNIRKAYQSEENAQYYEPLEVQKGLRLVEMLEKTISTQKSRRQMRLNKILGDESGNHRLLSPGNPAKNKHTRKPSIFKRGFSQKKMNKGPKELLEVNYVIIAEQITLLQFNLFKKIHPRECLKQAWKNKERKHKDAPNITQYIEAFNTLTKWIQSSILVAKDVKSRGKTIKRWVKVEEELLKLRNFQALCAVYCGLASSPIYRLKEAWSYVPKKHVTQHEEIRVIMKSTGNWKNLRSLQLQTHPPMLPYFGMFAQDMIVIEETTNNRSNDGSINWDALCRGQAAIDKHLIYQNSPYNNLNTDLSIQRWMNQELRVSGKLDDEWVYQVSDSVVLKDKRELGKVDKTNSPKKRGMSLWKSK